MKQSRRKFTEEYKREAVKLAGDLGSASEAARSLGIKPNLVHRWKREMAEDGVKAFPGKGNLKPDDEELRRLRRELEKVKRERDFLKKAVTYFAAEEKKNSDS
jgi:transposase